MKKSLRSPLAIAAAALIAAPAGAQPMQLTPPQETAPPAETNAAPAAPQAQESAAAPTGSQEELRGATTPLPQDFSMTAQKPIRSVSQRLETRLTQFSASLRFVWGSRIKRIKSASERIA
jgi:hypothetical protein